MAMACNIMLLNIIIGPAKEKGRNVDLDFPMDDFFMALALLATTRSRVKEEVYI